MVHRQLSKVLRVFHPLSLVCRFKRAMQEQKSHGVEMNGPKMGRSIPAFVAQTAQCTLIDTPYLVTVLFNLVNLQYQGRQRRYLSRLR